MKGRIYSIEELMLDDSFVNYCLSTGAAVSAQWKNIIRDNPEQEAVFDEAKNLVLALHGGLSKPEVNRQIEKVRQQLQGRKKDIIAVQPVYEPSLSSAFVTEAGGIRKRFFRVAASYLAVACILLAAGWWFFLSSRDSSPDNKNLEVRAGSFQTSLGERKTVSLPDGSVVILNSNSTVSWTNDFNKNTRQVHLTGDAFFKVAKNPAKAFTVFAENMATTAIGTEFYIHGQKGVENNIQVDLLEGKVSLKNTADKSNAPELILLPGQRGKTDRTSLQKTEFDSLQLRSWINGRILFHKTPALKALKQLEAWYGVEIIVKKQALKKRLINGQYEDMPLQDVLKVICFSINCRYSVSGNSIIIE